MPAAAKTVAVPTRVATVFMTVIICRRRSGGACLPFGAWSLALFTLAV